ncbi:MAG: hypothetical protein FWC36_08685 [Spirochaetes bacterium]|nr:hypothetical protein [Spirochaetota bacterium]
MTTIKPLVKYVKKAGKKAVKEQHKVKRKFKTDGSVITYIDKKLNEYLSKAIASLYPKAGLITEESPASCDGSKEFCFVVDPIDGTDSFSQGMPGWCVAIGLLKKGEPVAGIIYAPLWGGKKGTFIYSDIDGPVFVNGKKLSPDKIVYAPLADKDVQLAIASKTHHFFDFSAFKGKARVTGSAIINIIAPIIHGGIGGAVIPKAKIWDIAAPHAIVKKAKLNFLYFNGSNVDYSKLYDRSIIKDTIICGYENVCGIIKINFIRRHSESHINTKPEEVPGSITEQGGE